MRLGHQDIHYAIEKSGFKITHVIEGGAQGVDRAAQDYAKARGIPYTTVKANWEFYGKGAGPWRNMHMAQLQEPDACIAFCYAMQPITSGTASSIAENVRAGHGNIYIQEVQR